MKFFLAFLLVSVASVYGATILDGNQPAITFPCGGCDKPPRINLRCDWETLEFVLSIWEDRMADPPTLEAVKEKADDKVTIVPNMNKACPATFLPVQTRKWSFFNDGTRLSVVNGNSLRYEAVIKVNRTIMARDCEYEQLTSTIVTARCDAVPVQPEPDSLTPPPNTPCVFENCSSTSISCSCELVNDQYQITVAPRGSNSLASNLDYRVHQVLANPQGVAGIDYALVESGQPAKPFVEGPTGKTVTVGRAPKSYTFRTSVFGFIQHPGQQVHLTCVTKLCTPAGAEAIGSIKSCDSKDLFSKTPL